MTGPEDRETGTWDTTGLVEMLPPEAFTIRDESRSLTSTSEGRGTREIPLGILEIAELLNVTKRTVETWRYRGILPEPDMIVSSTPLWWRETVETFAAATGRG